MCERPMLVAIVVESDRIDGQTVDLLRQICEEGLRAEPSLIRHDVAVNVYSRFGDVPVDAPVLHLLDEVPATFDVDGERSWVHVYVRNTPPDALPSVVRDMVRGLVIEEAAPYTV